MVGIKEKKMIMTPDDGRKDGKTDKRTHPFVSWIAIGLGVFLIMIGGLLLLWGLSYMTTVGEPRDLDGEELTGSPLLVPSGVGCIAIGAIWLFQGWKGFKKPGDDLGMKNCPNCGRKIEEDLNFCYHCTATFAKEGDSELLEEEDTIEEVEPERRIPRKKEGPREPTLGQMERMRRQEERRRARERDQEDDRRTASSLAGLKEGMQGR